MSAGKPKVWRVLVANPVGLNRRPAVELEAPRRVLETPHPGLDRTTWMRGSASRG